MNEYQQKIQLDAARARMDRIQIMIDKQKNLMDLQGVVTQGLWERVRELEKWKQDIDKLLFPMRTLDPTKITWAQIINRLDRGKRHPWAVANVPVDE